VNANRAAGLVFTVLAAILAAILMRAAGPSPKPESAALSEFSAGRAVQMLRDVLGDDSPHPVGSPAHAAVLNRLTAKLAAIGYQPRQLPGFGCTADLTCAPVTNVVAELPGDARGDILLVTAHYDSVLAGPGASDDGVGMAAVLETARALRGEHFRNTIRFLITDGEESGLLGAEAVARDAEFLKGVAAVINIEDRGTSGSSMLFETSRHNRWLVPIIARALPRPSTSSLFYTVYELLPNDTDLTVFKRVGLAGVNFGAIGHIAHYHTPLDNLAHVRPSLVQDHGDHALAMTRALANADLRQSTDDNAVFFDVLSMMVVWWPQEWTMGIAIAVLAILLISAAMRLRRSASVGGVTLGIISFFSSIAIAAALAAAASWIISLRSGAAIWTAQPGPSITAGWLIGIGCAIAISTICIHRAGFDGLFIGHAICWAALAVALARFLPGVSYLAIVPAAAFTVAIALSATVAADVAVGSIICAAVTALLHFPFGLLFYDAFGRPSIVVIAIVLALVSTTFAPIVAAATSVRRATVSAMFLTALACVAMQLVIPPFTKESPRRLNIRYVDDGKRIEWEADALTKRLRAAGFARTLLDLPWLKAPSATAAAPAPHLQFEAPVATVVSREPKHVVIQVRSPRGAQRISLAFHTTRTAVVRVNGVGAPAEGHKRRADYAEGWRRVTIRGATEATIEIFLQNDEPIDAVISDYSYGLPKEANAIMTARDDEPAVPSDDSDGILIMRRIRL
jgi:hypothetical protein